MSNSFIDIITNVGKGVIGDKEVQTQAVVSLIQGTSGFAPIVDRSNPDTNVIILTDKHADLVDSLFAKGAKKLSSGPNKGKPPAIRINSDAISNRFIYKRVLPVLFITFIGGAALGYFLKK